MDGLKDTKNLKFSAYLRFKNVPVEKIEKIGRNRARYFFDLDETKWQELKLQFDKSDEFKYAQCLDAIADLAY